MAARNTKNQHIPESTSESVEEMRLLSERLRQADLKATRPRLLVLRLLQEMAGHRTIDELVKGLKARGTPLPRASVYNVIDTLVSRGLVMLADAGPGPALYEVSFTWHHHFVCTECGQVIDIPCIKGEKPCLLPDRVPGIVEETQIIFRGRCAQCLQKAETSALPPQ
jgi:Fe2+ or Zn2+ uptake regulation protein